MMKKLLFILLLFDIELAIGQLCFNPPINVSSSNQNQGLVLKTADFNEDGKIDLVSAFYSTNNLSLFLGTGTGSFGPAINFPGLDGPTGITVADFNSDGHDDVVATNFNSNSLSVFWGTGAGSFATVVNIGGFNSPMTLTSADFNLDGITDLAITHHQNTIDTISVLLGTGGGSFGGANKFRAGNFPSSIISSDFNADGKPDLAISNTYSNNISILLGTGIGSFNPAAFYPVGNHPNSLTSGDFNSDGKADLAVANGLSNDISVLLNIGPGLFGSSTQYTTCPAPTSIINADFDGDGLQDLAMENGNSNTVSILIGAGTGAFGSPNDFVVGTSPCSLISADFDGNGKADLAVNNFPSYNISILLNCTATGIADNNYNQLLTIYPNPAREEFYIEVNTTEILNINLYDSKGEHVLSKSVTDKSNIDVSSLQKGFYAVRVKMGCHLIYRKLVIL